MHAIETSQNPSTQLQSPPPSSLWEKATSAVNSTAAKTVSFVLEKNRKAALAFSQKVRNLANRLTETPGSPGHTGRKVISFLTQAKIVVTSEKMWAFFANGAIGKYFRLTTGFGALEVGAGLAGGWVAAAPAAAFGKAVGGMIGGNFIPLAAVGAGALVINQTNHDKLSLKASYQSLKEVSVARGTVLVSIIFALMGAHWQYGNFLEEQGEEAGRVSFEFFGSLLASIAAGYRISQWSSALSFAEYATNNTLQAATTKALDVFFPAEPLFRIPRNLILGISAYNAIPLSNLIKTIHKFLQSKERKDIALRIKASFKNSYEQPLNTARKARNKAAEEGEDLSQHDKKIKDLENQLNAMTTLLSVLDKILRLSIQTFNDYQEKLSSSEVALAQQVFIEIYQEAAKPGNETDDRSSHYEEQKALAKKRLCLVLNNAITPQPDPNTHVLLRLPEQFWKNAKQNGASALTNCFVTPKLDMILPDICAWEQLLLGFTITDPTRASITNELLKVHLHYFFTLGGTPILSEMASQLARDNIPEALRSDPVTQAPLRTDDDLDLIEGLLQLVLNHYKRIDANSPTVKACETILKTTLTWLKRGAKAAWNEWRDKSDHLLVAAEEGLLVQEEPVLVNTDGFEMVQYSD